MSRGAAVLMLQGTGSDVGKSLLVAGLCRLFTRRGLAVRPFKPQNMSNNAAVTEDGGEIGRAQALQARAAGVPLSVHMNPVLLKPQSEIGAQVVVRGRIHGTARARDYQAMKPTLLPSVLDSFQRLGAEADLVLVEGAGSPAEVNLRAGDIANMGFAEAADVPVVLVGDIDRGGVIASLCGTVDLLSESDRRHVKGFLVNRFRGDPSLFDEGMRIVERRTGLPGLGIVPFFPDAARLPPEDAVTLERPAHGPAAHGPLKIAVAAYPRIANFDDFDPLRQEPGVSVEMVRPGTALPGDAALYVLPGSKATIADLAALRETGWDVDIAAHLRRGGRVLGVCGGYQMLGRTLADPDGIEGPPGTVAGLGLLAVDTVMTGAKTLTKVSATHGESGEALTGYEMHVGRTEGADRARPLFALEGRADGAVSADGRVAGGYLHGVFANDGFRAAYLRALAPGFEAGLAYDAAVEAALDGLAAHLEASLDIEALLAISRAGSPAIESPS